MPNRNVRDTLIAAKIESPYGQDSAPTGANAILCSKPKVTPLKANNIDRDLVRPYFGASEQLVGTRNVTIELEVEAAGSGTAGTAPAFGPLLRACGFVQVVAAGVRVDYTPITNAQESVSLYYVDSGVLHKCIGARGTFKLDLTAGSRPAFMFMFTGLDGVPAEGSLSGVDFSAFRTPLAVVDANSGDVTFDGTVASTGAPVITGGTTYPSMGLELDIGNQVEFIPLLGGETVDITNRSLGGSVKLDLSAAQEVAFRADVLAANLRAVSLLHGTTAGNRFITHLRSAQLFDWSKEEVNGKRLVGYKLRGVPGAAGGGNDELRLTFF